jgi:hypothetical protein
MIKKLLVAITAISLLATGPAMAINTGAASVFSGVTWNVSFIVSGLQGCNQVYLDASGDFAQSTRFALYGGLNCPSLGGGYAAVGSGYFGSNGTFNMTINFGSGSQIICGNLNRSTLSGVCNVFNSAGPQIGTALLTLV